MARVKLDFGAEVDFLTKGELDDSLGKFEELFRGYAEGLKFIRTSNLLNAGAGVVATVPQGFAWMLTFLSLNATAAATVTVSRGETASIALAAPLTLAAAGPAVFTWSSRQVILMGGDELHVAASAGEIARWAIGAVEAPAEQIFKLIGG